MMIEIILLSYLEKRLKLIPEFNCIYFKFMIMYTYTYIYTHICIFLWISVQKETANEVSN